MARLRYVLFMLVCLPCCQAAAQSYPSKAITIVIPYPPGGYADIIARAIGQRLTEVWKRPVLIESKSGAATQIGASHVMQSPPDGYTLFATDITTFTNAYLFPKPGYDPAKGLVPVSGLGTIYHALAVTNSFPAQNMKEWIALARATPDLAAYANLGPGSANEMSMKLLESMTGVKARPVFYKGGAPAITDVIGGHVPMTFLSMTLMAGPSKAGQLRILGVGTLNRLPQFPDLPTIAETVPDYEASYWLGLFAPRGTPDHIVTMLNAEVQKIMLDPEFRATILDRNFYAPITGSVGQFAQYVEKTTTRLGKVMQNSEKPAP